ncbi:hypothetical protein PUNSTDRAFT_65390, partial [Punctularia strigosozonata HHB-11173 SS5]|uniref:uncharacterized protein n=1 Tax=Punctularia strigosozonata (strain HHB-11173) TaxID=741275 RepID=UPI00044177C0
HAGSMAQIGLCMGARHAKVLGNAVSFKSNIRKHKELCDANDEDIIGAMAVIWGLVCANMPSEVLKDIQESMEEAQMPRLSTLRISEGGTGYHIKVGGQQFDYPAAMRSPPQGVITKGYIA